MKHRQYNIPRVGDKILVLLKFFTAPVEVARARVVTGAHGLGVRLDGERAYIAMAFERMTRGHDWAWGWTGKEADAFRTAEALAARPFEVTEPQTTFERFYARDYTRPRL